MRHHELVTLGRDTLQNTSKTLAPLAAPSIFFLGGHLPLATVVLFERPRPKTRAQHASGARHPHIPPSAGCARSALDPRRFSTVPPRRWPRMANSPESQSRQKLVAPGTPRPTSLGGLMIGHGRGRNARPGLGSVDQSPSDWRPKGKWHGNPCTRPPTIMEAGYLLV